MGAGDVVVFRGAVQCIKVNGTNVYVFPEMSSYELKNTHMTSPALFRDRKFFYQQEKVFGSYLIQHHNMPKLITEVDPQLTEILTRCYGNPGRA